MQGGRPKWPSGEQEGGNPECHSGHMVFVYAVGENVEDGVSPMHDEVDAMDGRRFLAVRCCKPVGKQKFRR